MKSPDLKEIDEIRKRGFRPQVVACFLYDKKILFLYKKEHNLWQFPQGGIDNGETVEKAILREMREELGEDFLARVKIGEAISRDVIEFSSDKWGSRELVTDVGEKILMKGKEYFFVLVNPSGMILDVNQTEFDDYQWVDYEEAFKITEKIYQKEKRRMTEDILKKMHKIGLL